MLGMNKATLIGNLGNDPKIYAKNKLSIARFRLATTEIYKSHNGDRQEKTEWHTITAFGKLALICGKYLSRGKQVYIEGHIRNGEWEDNAGKARLTTEIVATKMIMLGTKAAAKYPPDKLSGKDHK